jgi:hypothetical protein|tara:strand:+ start:344 stop:526 length:183 start_codon:yes stop_codon:yes gene_type:complete
MKVAPLKASFMIISIIGFFVSVYMSNDFWLEWSFTFAVFFVLMFIASLISMTYAPLRDYK